LAGLTLSDLLSGPIEGLSPKLYNAFKMAAEALVKEPAATDTPEAEVSENTGAPQPVLEDSGGGAAPDNTGEEVVVSARDDEKSAESVV